MKKSMLAIGSVAVLLAGGATALSAESSDAAQIPPAV